MVLKDWPRMFTSGIAEFDIPTRAEASPHTSKKLHRRTVHVYVYEASSTLLGTTRRPDAKAALLSAIKSLTKLMLGLKLSTLRPTVFHARPPDPEEPTKSTTMLSHIPTRAGSDNTTVGLTATAGRLICTADAAAVSQE